MLKKTIIILVLSFGAVALSHAQQVPAPFPVEPQENVHKSRDSLFRACKNEADIKQLAGDARSSFIANCVKKPVQ